MYEYKKKKTQLCKYVIFVSSLHKKYFIALAVAVPLAVAKAVTAAVVVAAATVVVAAVAMLR